MNKWDFDREGVTWGYDSDNDSSADNTPLICHMGANRCMRRPQAVIPLVTPWSRYLLQRWATRAGAGPSTWPLWTARSR